MRWIAAFLLAALCLAACSSSSPAPKAAVAPHADLAHFGGPACGPDASAELTSYFNALPSGSTITLPQDACFTVDSTVLIQSRTNLTINGNGSTFKQAALMAGSFDPILELYQDHNLKITGLTLEGGYDGTNGGGGFEGDYGLLFEADNGVTFTGSTIEDIQGDWVYLSPPYDVTPVAVSTNVTLSNDTFDHAGYHGFTVESVGCLTLAPCNGLTVSTSNMNDINVDAMDFEVDNSSTDFNPNGAPADFAQDWVKIVNNTWSNWGDDWFASLQGQTPGVQEQHLTFSANKLDSNGALFEVTGTFGPTTSTQYLNLYWTIKNNAFASGFYGAPYQGGASPPNSLYNISQLTMTNNAFRICGNRTDGVPLPFALCEPNAQYEMDMYGSSGIVENNDFSGSASPLVNIVGFTTTTFCGNKYGPSMAIDHPC